MFENKKTYMESEIIEQAKIIPIILSKYVNPESGEINISLPQNISKIIFVASGSSYHSARFAVDLTEKISKIQARAIYSSEFLLKNIIPGDNNSLYIFITQSGETSDTLKSVERVKNETNIPTLCVTNAINSSIWKMCDYQVACCAGEEHGIAATKSFTAQILCLILISLKLIENSKEQEALSSYKNSLQKLPEITEYIISEKRKQIKLLAKHLAKEDVIIITADGISYSIAKECALKIKETSYKNVNAAILGEFMHGHVAVLNNKSTFIYITADNITERSVNNITKIKSDYNPAIVIIGKCNKQIKTDFNICISNDNIMEQLFANIIIIQLLALETALNLNRNVDHPKGLHKVVIDKSV